MEKLCTCYHYEVSKLFFVAVVATSVVMTGGCGYTPKCTVDVRTRSDLALDSYRVFYLDPSEASVPDLSEKERNSKKTLNTVRTAVVDELKERGFTATSNAKATDVNALITYGYSFAGQRGTNVTSTPGSAFTAKGQTYVVPGTVAVNSYAQDNQTIWLEVYDWSELKVAKFDFDRVRPAWRGSIDYTSQGVNGITRDEASLMVMNMLADFPTPRPGLEGQRPVVFPNDRATLFSGGSSKQ